MSWKVYYIQSVPWETSSPIYFPNTICSINDWGMNPGPGKRVLQFNFLSIQQSTSYQGDFAMFHPPFISGPLFPLSTPAFHYVRYLCGYPLVGPTKNTTSVHGSITWLSTVFKIKPWAYQIKDEKCWPLIHRFNRVPIQEWPGWAFFGIPLGCCHR